jgi:Ca-activated chloride channel family protein
VAVHSWFANPWFLLSLGVLPVLALLAIRARVRRRRALALLGSIPAIEGRLGAGNRWRWWRGVSAVLALVLLGAAAAGPRWGRDWEQSATPGRDLVVVLDCSQSMLAETPSRLDRARKAVLDLCSAVEKRGGHRLALVLFAARARLVCPLTEDCDHLRELVGRLDDFLDAGELLPGPHDVSGTRIGDAVEEALAAHDPRYQRAQDILLLSDGDDPAAADGEWRKGIATARELGIAVTTVGLGDPDNASPIPVADGTLKHAGREVRTRLQEAPLREIARQTRGEYIPARTQVLHLGEIYLDRIAGREQREESEDALPVQKPRHLGLLLGACMFLATVMLLPDARPRSRIAEGRAS